MCGAQIHEAQARDLFSELEFFKLLQEMPTPPPTPLPQRTTVITHVEGLRALASQARQAAEMTVIPAYQGLAHSAECIGLGIALPGDRTFYVPLAHRGFAAGDQVARADFVAELGPVFSAPEVRKIGHNLKALWLLLANVGISLEGIGADVELLSYLLNPSRANTLCRTSRGSACASKFRRCRLRRWARRGSAGAAGRR